MQYDVKAAYQAGADGVMVAARTRIKGVFYSVVYNWSCNYLL
jgi:hypothetical protein